MAVTLDKDTNINYRYSLPNKLFDYIQARLPVMASDLVEIRKVIEDYEVGRIVSSHDPEILAKTAEEILRNTTQYEIWKEKLRFASQELCWEHEEQELTQIYAHLAG
jgi:glycosyltransferase involved in cell wall biosynthesis